MRKQTTPVSLHSFLAAVTKSIEASDIKLSERSDEQPMRLTKVTVNIFLHIAPPLKDKGNEEADLDDIIIDFSGNGNGNSVNLSIEYTKNAEQL